MKLTGEEFPELDSELPEPGLCSRTCHHITQTTAAPLHFVLIKDVQITGVAEPFLLLRTPDSTQA